MRLRAVRIQARNLHHDWNCVSPASAVPFYQRRLGQGLKFLRARGRRAENRLLLVISAAALVLLAAAARAWIVRPTSTEGSSIGSSFLLGP